MPSHLTWTFGERLKALGFEIVNEGISGAVHRDRQLITGDSPLAGHALGKLAAETLLKDIAAGHEHCNRPGSIPQSTRY